MKFGLFSIIFTICGFLMVKLIFIQFVPQGSVAIILYIVGIVFGIGSVLKESGKDKVMGVIGLFLSILLLFFAVTLAGIE